MIRLPMFMALFCGCMNTKPVSGSGSSFEPADPHSSTGAPSSDTGESHDSGAMGDSGQTDEPVGPLRLEGRMSAEYTYSGSLGEFTDVCEGDAFITIEAQTVIAGEGVCANDIITFGFVIDGVQDGDELTGNLVGESAAGRAETPFSGTLTGSQTVLEFDHIHAADGESLRLVGVVDLAGTE